MRLNVLNLQPSSTRPGIAFSSGDSMRPMEVDVSKSLTLRPLVYEVPLRMWLKRKGTSQGEE